MRAGLQSADGVPLTSSKCRKVESAIKPCVIDYVYMHVALMQSVFLPVVFVYIYPGLEVTCVMTHVPVIKLLLCIWTVIESLFSIDIQRGE